MKRRLFLSLFAVAGLTASALFAKVENGADAAAFSLPGHDGKTHSLADAKGKFVVLEWTNPGCPFVKKHYDKGDMQKLQKTYTGKGVVWFTIATGKSPLTAATASGYVSEKGLGSTVLLDADGAVAKAYSAKSTPHLFVINPEGKVIYQGAIDSNNSSDQADIAGATNYVAAALDAAMAGKTVAKAKSDPYGCGVKY